MARAETNVAVPWALLAASIALRALVVAVEVPDPTHTLLSSASTLLAVAIVVLGVQRMVINVVRWRQGR